MVVPFLNYLEGPKAFRVKRVSQAHKWRFWKKKLLLPDIHCAKFQHSAVFNFSRLPRSFDSKLQQTKKNTFTFVWNNDTPPYAHWGYLLGEFDLWSGAQSLCYRSNWEHWCKNWEIRYVFFILIYRPFICLLLFIYYRNTYFIVICVIEVKISFMYIFLYR